jgi:acyl-coenzyme A synthetase/AMP-(fatty) acid ligase
MGDLGYRDPTGRFWFCGRRVEQVVTEHRPYFTDCVEGIANAHPEVARTALIGFGEHPRQTPALVIEPADPGLLKDASWRSRLAEAMRERLARFEASRGITTVLFHRSFPVDVRHNAKIHRLTLARYFAAR